MNTQTAHSKQFTVRSLGFTLIEMLVAISVAAVIGSVGIASYTSYSSQQALNNVAQDIKTIVENAKNNAISRVKPTNCTDSNPLQGYRVLINQSDSGASLPNHYELGYVCNSSAAIPPDEAIHQVYNNKSVTLRTGITLTGSTCTEIKFLTLSNVVTLNGSSTPCTIIVNGSGKTILMTVNSSGTVTF